MRDNRQKMLIQVVVAEFWHPTVALLLKWRLVLVCCFFLMVNCESNELVPPAAVPSISIDAVSPLTVVQFQEKINMEIEYEDGNGDIGFEDPDIPVVYVRDSRLTSPDEYHVPPLAPSGSQVPIQGVFSLELKNTFLLGNGDIEIITYEVWLVDRAGNESNKVITPQITILRD